MSLTREWIHQHPLMGRYSSSKIKAQLGNFDLNLPECGPLQAKILEIFSPMEKAVGWRRLWLALAKAQRKLGIQISDEQIQIQESLVRKIDLKACATEERLTRHDVMAHLHVLKTQMNAIQKDSAKHLHLGATSCFVTDNQEIIAQTEALNIFIKNSAHAQLKTDLENLRKQIKARGVKGTTGSQASYFELFEGDFNKVLELEQLVMRELGFESSYIVTGQTYPRIQDLFLVGKLYNLSKHYEGSIARSIQQKLYSIRQSLAHMASQQWLERSLDDSAQRRVQICEAFQFFAQLMESDCTYKGASYLSLSPSLSKAIKVLIETQANVLDRMSQFAERYKKNACIGYTHYQVAQPVTYGKRISLWIQHLLPAFELLQNCIQNTKINSLDLNLAFDLWASGSSKIGVDCRLLQHDHELSEPFGKSQIGSSAMAYKKNPMRSERLCSLSRVKLDQLQFCNSPEMSILCIDSLLQLKLSIFSPDSENQIGFHVQELNVSQRLDQVLPFLVSERLLMLAAQKGADRQEMHEIIRLCMLEARKQMQSNPGLVNPFLDLLDKTDFPIKQKDVPDLGEPERYIGFCVEQVEYFLDQARPIWSKYKKHHEQQIEEVRV